MQALLMPVITVDGPSGSGKGTVCRLLADKLGWDVLDSGAIYRVLSLAALHHQIALDNEEGLVPLAANLDVQCSCGSTLARIHNHDRRMHNERKISGSDSSQSQV